MSKISIATAILVVLVMSMGGYKLMGRQKDFRELVNIISEKNHRVPIHNVTRETLDAIPDESLEETIVYFVLDEKIKGDYENEYEIVMSLPEGLQYVYATWWLEAEVNNGGFNQYFYNSAGAFQQEALEGLRRMEAREHARLLSEAISIYGDEKELHEEVKRKGTLEAFSASYAKTALVNLDEQYDSLAENLSGLRIAYIRNHPEEFISN